MDKTSMELEGDRAVVIARTVDAPARIVFDAWTKPELVARWWAPASLGVSMVSCDADVRVGGRYRYVVRNADGGEAAFSGAYTEITAPSRLVYTQVFEAFPDAEMTITVTFEEQGDKTRLVSYEVYPSKEARDGALAHGMEKGMRVTMNQLAELVSTLR